MSSEKLDEVLSAQKRKTGLRYAISSGPSSSTASRSRTVFVPQSEKGGKSMKSITHLSNSKSFVRPHVYHHCFVLIALSCILKSKCPNGYRFPLKDLHLLLGSKELGINVLELHFVTLANHDQNVLVLFKLAQSMCFYVKLELSYGRIYCVNLPSSIDRKSCILFFL